MMNREEIIETLGGPSTVPWFEWDGVDDNGCPINFRPLGTPVRDRDTEKLIQEEWPGNYPD